jgi:hypothetical protein
MAICHECNGFGITHYGPEIWECEKCSKCDGRGSVEFIEPYLIIYTDDKQKRIELPLYGTVTITCHDGEVKYIETTTKEKV